MCLLLDDPELSQFPSTRRQSAGAEQADAKEAKDERRLIIAPLYAGGDIAEYVLPWSKYQEVDEKPWDGGSRIMMHFEGVDAENEARGIVSVDGCVYYLGRVRKVRSSPDRWETVMVVFDSDPEDYMWVSPWEIIAAPEKYHDPVHVGPAPVDHGKGTVSRRHDAHRTVQSHRATTGLAFGRPPQGFRQVPRRSLRGWCYSSSPNILRRADESAPRVHRSHAPRRIRTSHALQVLESGCAYARPRFEYANERVVRHEKVLRKDVYSRWKST